MQFDLKPLAAVAALALSLAVPASAEESGSEAPATADQLLDMGQDVESSEGPKIGENYSREVHGDWNIVCVESGTDEDPCSMGQIMVASDGQPLAEISLFRIEEAGAQAVAGATIVVPLETLLPEGLTISIDEGKGKRYGYDFCNQIGCYARIGLTQQDIDALKKGSTGLLTLKPAMAPEKTIEIEMSLKGFTAAYDVVDVVKQ